MFKNTRYYFGIQSNRHNITATSLHRPFFSWRTVHTFIVVSTSLQLPFILADSAYSPYIHSCFSLFTTAIYLGGQSIHSFLFQPLYNCHLSWRTVHTVHTFILVSASLQLPFILADSPYTESCFRLSTMATIFCLQGGRLREVQLYLKTLSPVGK